MYLREHSAHTTVTSQAMAQKLSRATEVGGGERECERCAERQAVGWRFARPTTVDAIPTTSNLRCRERTPVPLAEIRNCGGSGHSGGAGTERQYSSE